MIYTVTPLERIYSNRSSGDENKGNNQVNTREEEERKSISLTHGRVYMKRNGSDYIIDGIQSTDMSDYLSEDYSLGGKYQTKD